MHEALKIIVKGKVQGVGFRPFVYSLSRKYHLNGTVQNNLDGVVIHAEGDQRQLEQMVKELKLSPPKLAKISEITVHHVQRANYKKFTIAESQKKGDSVPWVPADAAVCEQCSKKMRDPQNRRYQYPFINCTQCGPRYTMINHLPYDRPGTTMARFEMCPDCRAEYEDPSNRRHHAEPVCCPTCGPIVTLLNQTGESLAENQPAIARTAELLEQGCVIAVKGIGGYHLVCDAYQESAVGRIRLRKNRPQRPLALMVKSLAVAKKFCHISRREEEILTSPEMPIVILQQRREGMLPDNISPGLSTLGIMLPYTPLHHLLFENNRLECLVMTSANPSGLPMPYKNQLRRAFTNDV
ncbi:Sua5/YciO/YrdC/YwlC family protein [Terrilactibacillus sp. S3-3]|nr:Sua5/YciO/YrdC/YwlC family protein [Terrilactibacillus sp. S3-3]